MTPGSVPKIRTPTPIVGNRAKCKKRLAAPSPKVYSGPLAAKLQLRLWLAESRQPATAQAVSTVLAADHLLAVRDVAAY